ncbi:hypothetical protein K435DRAFT_967524 [Dendrothele bispora CBS 962.96]|uniref:Spt5 transcription elongation factor N-terminal domain-containing protein n=1 Tax=Dendrothele bispora (strain CBS 962.96) TaxID=1314807 RepID=A0A4S8LTP8_DENBC|nr:hypothetical protein K435DRAFT_967524 [Dendrothele bispora CBS 962.96]
MIPPSLQRHVLNMLIPPKKSNLSCLKLVSDIVDETQEHQHHQSYQYHHQQQQHQQQQLQLTPSKGVYIPGNHPHPNSHSHSNAEGSSCHLTRKRLSLQTLRIRTTWQLDLKIIISLITLRWRWPYQQGYITCQQQQPHHRYPQRSLDAAAVPLPPPPRPTSRWKEDWEELELCGATAGGGGTWRNRVQALPILKGASDGNSRHQPINPFLRSVDGINTHDSSYYLTPAGGMTTAQVLPGSTNNIGRQVVNLDAMIRLTNEFHFPIASFRHGDHPVLASRHLLYEAQQAFYYGLQPGLAIASVTSTPADTPGIFGTGIPSGDGLFFLGLSVAFHTGALNVFDVNGGDEGGEGEREGEGEGEGEKAVIKDEVGLHVAMGHDMNVGLSTQIGMLREMISGSKGSWEEVRNGELPLIIHVDNVDIMATLIKLKYDTEMDSHSNARIRMTFTGASEAHILADEIARAGIAVVLTPSRLFPRSWDARRTLCTPLCQTLKIMDMTTTTKKATKGTRKMRRMLKMMMQTTNRLAENCTRMMMMTSIEAEVSDEDEEEEDDEEYGVDGFFETGGAEDDDSSRRHHARLARRQMEEEEKSPKQIARDLNQRYGGRAAVRYTGDMNEIPQRLLMPSVHEASLWQVRVKPGREREIVFSLPGSQRSSWCLSHGINLVPIEEMASLLQIKKQDTTVVDIAENGEEVGLKFIPRIDLTPRDDGGDKKRKKTAGMRPPQQLFNFEESKSTVGIMSQREDLLSSSKINALILEDVNPTLDEITQFSRRQDGLEENMVDLSIIAEASRKAAISVLQPGEHVISG